MEITEIKVHLRGEDKLKAFVTVTFEDCFVVRNMKIIESSHGPILCMPSRRLSDGSYKDVAHPITQEFRKALEDRIFAAYDEERRRAPAPEKGRAPGAKLAGDRGEPRRE